MRSYLSTLAVVLIVLSLLMTALLTEIVLYSRNSLMVHPKWVSGKLILIEPTMGSIEGFITRNILSRNRLNLHQWHGYNEILFNRIIHVGSIRFKFFLEDDGYLSAIFNKNKNVLSGIRISRNPKFPSMFFRATSEGKFLLKEQMAALTITDTWHDAELVFRANKLILSLDGHVVRQFKESSLNQQLVGFKSGNNTAIVDDVEVNDINENQLIKEDFRNVNGYWKLMFFNFVSVAVILGIAILTSVIIKRDPNKTLLNLALIQLVVIIVFAQYYCFDYFFWSRKYHQKIPVNWGRVVFDKQTGIIEKRRLKLFTRFPYYDPYYSEKYSFSPNALTDFLNVDHKMKFRKINLQIIRSDDLNGQKIDIIDSNYEAIQTYLKLKPFFSGTRILFIGTSQLWGAGAILSSDQIASKTHEALSKHLDERNNIYLINASKRGSQSKELLQRYRDYLYLFKPNIVVIDLSNNDLSDQFRENLYSIIKFTRDIGSKNLLVLEANSIEVKNQSLENNHKTMLSLARENDIPLVNLHGYLSNKDVYDLGLLWWDRVHLTSYGQELAAEFITQGIIDNFEVLNPTAP